MVLFGIEQVGHSRDDIFEQLYRDGWFGVTPVENAPLLVESIGPVLAAKPPCERRTLVGASGSLVARRVEPMLVDESLEFVEGSRSGCNHIDGLRRTV